jgi:hypothetical protein
MLAGPPPATCVHTLALAHAAAKAVALPPVTLPQVYTSAAILGFVAAHDAFTVAKMDMHVALETQKAPWHSLEESLSSGS